MAALNTATTVRLVAAVVLMICGVVVLGISAHVEHSVRQFGLKSSTYTYDAFVGALTLFVELGMLIARFVLVKPGSGAKSSRVVSLGVEMGLASLLFGLWFAAAIATTITSVDGRSICRHLDDLFNQPELEGLDKNALAVARNILESSCSEIHAELAFLWIGTIVAFFLDFYLVVLGARQQSRGNREIWALPLAKYDLAAHSTINDPFSDPVGAEPGPVAGVAPSRGNL